MNSIRPIAETKDTVTLTRHDFNTLREQAEDAHDLAQHRRAEAALAAGESETLPAAMVRRMLKGENLVRLWREHRDMSAKDLAGAAGVNRGYLSEIENGLKPGSLAAMGRLAAALRIRVDDLIAQK